jgi:hypothetical protein
MNQRSLTSDRPPPKPGLESAPNSPSTRQTMDNVRKATGPYQTASMAEEYDRTLRLSTVMAPGGRSTLAGPLLAWPDGRRR